MRASFFVTPVMACASALVVMFMLAGFLLPASSQASSASVFEAEQAIQRKDFIEARRLLEQPARNGDAVAEDMLGHMLLFGRGGPMETTRGVGLLRSAANKGRPEAQNSMGIVFMTGLDGTIDATRGVEWFRKAAANGHAEAMFNLGRAAEQGLGMPRSIHDAKKWYASASERGNHDARIRLAELDASEKRDTKSGASARK